MDANDLPIELRRYLADSDLSVLSWNAGAGELKARIVKEIGHESGVISFNGVSHVNMPCRFEISGIDVVPFTELFPAEYEKAMLQERFQLEPGEIAYLFRGVDGEYFVIAAAMEYETEGSSQTLAEDIRDKLGLSNWKRDPN